EDRWAVDDPPVAEEGGAALIPPERQPLDSCRRTRVLRQGRAQVFASRCGPYAGYRRARRTTRGRAPGQLHREERRPDAVLREHWRLPERGYDGRHLGDGRLV